MILQWLLSAAVCLMYSMKEQESNPAGRLKLAVETR